MGDMPASALEGSIGPLVPVRECIADIANALWRVQNSLDDKESDHAIVIRRISRHTQSALDALQSAVIEIRNYSNEPYSVGMAVSVLAFQPTPGLEREMILETIKPSIYFKDTLIQRADVIVGVPEFRTSKADRESVNKSSEDTTQ